MIICQIASSYSIEDYAVQLYHEMLGMSGYLITTASSFAALLAMFQVAAHIYRPLAAGEPVNLLPITRPFLIGMVLLVFNSAVTSLSDVLDQVNAVMKFTVSGEFQEAQAMKERRDIAMENLIQRRLDEIDRKYESAQSDTYNPVVLMAENVTAGFEKFGEKFAYYSQKWMGDILEKTIEILALAARIIILTIRSFSLIVLAIIGPISLALSIFEPFKNTIWTWLSRFIQVHLWLPVCNVFSAINAKLLVKSYTYDLAQIQAGNYVDSVDLLYCTMLLVGVAGYVSVPTVTGWIIESAGGGGGWLGSMNKAGGLAAKAAGGIAGNLASMSRPKPTTPK